VPPDWTNWRESDPGVALLELFAFLAEDLLGVDRRRRRRRRLLVLGGVSSAVAVAWLAARARAGD